MSKTNSSKRWRLHIMQCASSSFLATKYSYNRDRFRFFYIRRQSWIAVLSLLYFLASAHVDLKVKKGQITFDAEGNDNPRSRYFSRKLHVPSRWSGVTIGRGYDIKYKSKRMVVRDLRTAGISSKDASKISKLVGKSGRTARASLRSAKLNNYVITRKQQKKLFEISYARQERETARLVRKYYKKNYNHLQKKIQEILVDLKFRGDFRPRRRSAAMRGIKSAVLKNSIPELKKVISNRRIWKNVPYDRFARRKNYI
eukprot:gene7035-7825_t